MPQPTLIEMASRHVRRNFPSDTNGKAAAQAVFIALEQPGSVVRITIEKSGQLDTVHQVMNALDIALAIDHAKSDFIKDAHNRTIELTNGSAIEFHIPPGDPSESQ